MDLYIIYLHPTPLLPCYTCYSCGHLYYGLITGNYGGFLYVYGVHGVWDIGMFIYFALVVTLKVKIIFG